MKLLINEAGSAVVGMYDDRLLSLARRLGFNAPQVKRASHLIWNGKGWVAFSTADTRDVLAEDPTRAGALQKEHQVVESNLATYV